MQITFLARKSDLIYRRGLRQRVASLTIDYNGVFAIRAYSIGTRSREYDVVVPRVRGPGSSTFAFTAAKLWNALPANIQRIDTPGSFRRAILMFLVRKYESYDSNPFLYS